jgi:prepilin-type N-terminal cleavage/methylation domain-containing protein
MKTVKQSFTLVEILVVIVIIGILSSFIFFTINDSVEKASIAKSKMFSESIRNNLLLNLVSEWTFDTGTTTAGNTATNNDVKDAWGSNNGTIMGGPKIKGEADCVSGRCLYLDGLDDSVNIAVTNGSLEGLKTIALSFWCKGSCSLEDVSEMQLFEIGLNETIIAANLEETDGSDFPISASFSNSGDWNFILMTYDATAMDVYLNTEGVLHRGITSMDLDDTVKNIRLNYLVGSGIIEEHMGCGDGYLEGTLDEIMIYNQNIPASQIKQNYLSGLNNLYAKGLITELEYNEKLSEL